MRNYLSTYIYIYTYAFSIVIRERMSILIMYSLLVLSTYGPTTASQSAVCGYAQLQLQLLRPISQLLQLPPPLL